MKALQTIGVYLNTGLPGIFEYRRDSGGLEITIEGSNRAPSLGTPRIYIPNPAWNNLLQALEGHTGSIRITKSDEVVSIQSLAETNLGQHIVELPARTACNWNDSFGS